jgi:hypothetical protein
MTWGENAALLRICGAFEMLCSNTKAAAEKRHELSSGTILCIRKLPSSWTLSGPDNGEDVERGAIVLS